MPPRVGGFVKTAQACRGHKGAQFGQRRGSDARRVAFWSMPMRKTSLPKHTQRHQNESVTDRSIEKRFFEVGRKFSKGLHMQTANNLKWIPKSKPKINNGRVFLNSDTLKKNRMFLGLSQMSLAEYACAAGQPISIASIKRAELGRPVLFKTARQFAMLFNTDISEIVIYDRLEI